MRAGQEAPTARGLERLVQARTGLPGEALHPDLRLAELGLDSVALLELLLECERLAGRPLAPRLLEGAPLTLGQLLAALLEPLADGPER